MNRTHLLSLALAFTLGALATQTLSKFASSPSHTTRTTTATTKAVTNSDRAVVSPDLAHRKKRIWV